MSLRDRLRRLQRVAEGPIVTIPQRDGTVKRFPEREMGPAYLDALDQELGRKNPHEPEHPICAAARNSSDPAWQGSSLVTDAPEKPVENLFE